MSLKNKVALVTASTRGIGLAVVQKLAREKATVYMAARRLDAAQAIADPLNAQGMKVRTVFFDAYAPESFETMIQAVVQAEGHLDILVNNFGTSNPMTDKTIEDTTWDTFQSIVDVNLQSVFRLSQLAIEAMKKNGGGSIINISSVAGTVPDISQIAYGTSKAAINYLTRLIAVQEGRNRIRCNAVLPGMTATDAVRDSLSDSFRQFFLRHVPIDRMGEPEEVAAAVAYFASDDSAYVTGQILEVSGGFGLATPVFADAQDPGQKR